METRCKPGVEVYCCRGYDIRNERGITVKYSMYEIFSTGSQPRGTGKLKVLLLNAEAPEALLYGYVTWAPRCDDYALVQTTNILRVVWFRRARGTYRPLEKTGNRCLEAILQQR